MPILKYNKTHGRKVIVLTGCNYTLTFDPWYKEETIRFSTLTTVRASVVSKDISVTFGKANCCYYATHTSSDMFLLSGVYVVNPWLW